MGNEAKYYFLTIEQGQFNFRYGDFSSAVPQGISGLFAYVAYESITGEKLFFMQKLLNYASSHSGIALFFSSFKKKERVSFFATPETQQQFSKYSRSEPRFGGEMLLLDGDFIFWNFKSRMFSLNKPGYDDSSPELEQTIASCLLPPERFIKSAVAESFAESTMPHYFEPNGQYKTPGLATHVALMICNDLQLPPRLALQAPPPPVERQAPAC